MKPINYTTELYPHDLAYILNNLPPEVHREAAVAKQSASQMIIEATCMSERTYTIYHEHIPIALMGITDKGYTWLVATIDVAKHVRTFLFGSREILANQFERHPQFVWSIIPTWYEANMRWCKWLGGQLGGLIDYHGDSWQYIYFIKENVIGGGAKWALSKHC